MDLVALELSALQPANACPNDWPVDTLGAARTGVFTVCDGHNPAGPQVFQVPPPWPVIGMLQAIMLFNWVIEG